MFRNHDPDTVLVSRVDPANPLASYSKHAFHLDGAHWPSVEHYYQAMKFDDSAIREQIRNAPHPDRPPGSRADGGAESARVGTT